MNARVGAEPRPDDEAEEGDPKPGAQAPPWTVERPTIEEAIYFLEIRAGTMSEDQYRYVQNGLRAKVDPEVMREAFVFRHLATQLRWKLFKEGKPQP